MMNKLELVATAWLLAWGISNIMTAIFTPSIAGDVGSDAVLGMLFYGSLGIILTTVTILLQFKLSTLTRVFLCYILFALAVMSVFGTVASWSGIAVWDVPFADKAGFNISMAFMDFISAVFMLILALGKQVEP